MASLLVSQFFLDPLWLKNLQLLSCSIGFLSPQMRLESTQQTTSKPHRWSETGQQGRLQQIQARILLEDYFELVIACT